MLGIFNGLKSKPFGLVVHIKHWFPKSSTAVENKNLVFPCKTNTKTPPVFVAQTKLIIQINSYFNPEMTNK